MCLSIKTINRRTRADLDGTLTLDVMESEAEDSGCYEVRVVSDCGMVASDSEVLVHFEAPRFSLPLTDKTVCLGEDTELTCTATGIPRPQVTWLLDGNPIAGDAVVTWSPDDVRGPVTTSLTVRQIGVAEVRQSYSCQAKNSVGETTISARLLLKGLVLSHIAT